MKNIFKIYKRDIKSILFNWVALVVALGLMILPALYAWFNIKSSWDPYSNTSGILVAVVNKDKGGNLKDTKVNVGAEVVKKLKENKDIGWRFVDSKEAQKGVNYGKYYASIIITEDFSTKILSIIENNPQKPELIYSVNEKINAVAPKITKKGVTNIQSEVDKAFVQMVNGIIFDLFNKLGVELDIKKPELENFKRILFEIDMKTPKINEAVDSIYSEGVILENFMKKVQENMPLVKDTVSKSADVAEKAQGFLVKAKDGVEKSAPVIKQDLVLAEDILSSLQVMIPEASELIATDTSKARDMFSRARDKLSNVINKIDTVIKLMQSLQESSNNGVIDSFVGKLTNIRNKLENEVSLIDNVIENIDKGTAPSIDILNRINEQIKETNTLLSTLVNDFDSSIVPNINAIMDGLVSTATNSLKLLQDANNDLPTVIDLLNKSYGAVTIGMQEIKLLRERLPQAEESIHSLVQRIKSLDEDVSLNEIIRLLKNDAKKESEFISNPIVIKENRIFPIPNYGSAMSPFFSTLSLWVGCLILVSILSMEVHPLEEGKRLKIYQVYFGRYLTFATIAILQALTVTLGDLFILKTYASDKLAFVLYSVFVSIVFSMIVYTLVSILGNVGKAVCVILLVLQISSSGGTFPIQVTPPFFQHINPFLPFTYAISGMRETVGGIIPEILSYNISVLLIYCVISIVLALVLKGKLNKLNKIFVDKFKDTGLVEK